MWKQTIIWTALPRKSDGPVAKGTHLHLSVFVSPHLWNDDANAGPAKLGTFPDWTDWPAAIGQATFRVQFGQGLELEAVPEDVHLRSDAWRALFKPNTPVLPDVFEDLSGVGLETFPAAVIHDTVKEVYQQVATDDRYGAGKTVPGWSVLAAVPGIADIALPVKPIVPRAPAPRKPRPVHIDVPKDDKKGCSHWGCVAWPMGVARKILKKLGFLAMLPFTMIGDPVIWHSWGSGGGPATPPMAAFGQLRRFLEPYASGETQAPTPLPDRDLDEEYDFHKMVAALGDYPRLLRMMGLVVDLVVTLGDDLPPETSTVQILPSLPLQFPDTMPSHCPKTHYRLQDRLFVTLERPVDPEIHNGLLHLDDKTRFRVTQIDVAGSGIKLQDASTNVVATKEHGLSSPVSIEETGLPGLQTAGISVIRPDLSVELRNNLVRSWSLNHSRATADGSPKLPLQGPPDPHPLPGDEYYAEDLVLGYRIDVWDDKSNKWHSLCRRLGTYEFLDGPLTLPEPDPVPGSGAGLEDEGFVQLSVTEPLSATGPRVLRVHESLFTWNGWSLCAPRPGQPIPNREATEPHPDQPDNPATRFKLKTTFVAKPRSLPRLRFGYTYQLRARVVDLAGNSVFGPEEDDAFQHKYPEVSPPFAFRRFEPVGTPVAVLAAKPAEGESLERLVVRSSVGDPVETIKAAPTSRYLFPPKVAQLMAELHGRFDGPAGMAGDAAGYDLAAREANSPTHVLDLGTLELKPAAGVKEELSEDKKTTIPVQTVTPEPVSYLPDPNSRGIMLLGLPGVPGSVFSGGGKPVLLHENPFHWKWQEAEPANAQAPADLKAFNLRLAGIPAGASPAAPQKDEAAGVVTVELPRGKRPSCASALTWTSRTSKR